MKTALHQTKQANPAPPLDNPATFARFASVTPQCVRNWCRDGRIPLTINCGRIVRFERSAALAALNLTGAATR